MGGVKKTCAAFMEPWVQAPELPNRWARWAVTGPLTAASLTRISAQEWDPSLLSCEDRIIISLLHLLNISSLDGNPGKVGIFYNFESRKGICLMSSITTWQQGSLLTPSISLSFFHSIPKAGHTSQKSDCLGTPYLKEPSQLKWTNNTVLAFFYFNVISLLLNTE